MKSSLITFLGDIYLPSEYKSEIAFCNYIVNLEYPITKSIDALPDKVNLKTEKNYLLSTLGQGAFAVCLANNHIMDYGEKGLLDTISRLKKDNIRFYGVGIKQNHYNRINIVDHHGLKVALLGYVCESTSPGMDKNSQSSVSQIMLEKIRVDINNVKALQVDRIIVSFHWGAEEVVMPKPDDIIIARAVIDMGADLIIGHHAHCIQDYEMYKDKYIFYGLGNCIFPDLELDAFFDPDTKQTTRKYIKKQNYWNKYSLAVEYNIKTGQVGIKKLYFDGNILKNNKVLKNNKIKTISLTEIYNIKFMIIYILCKIRYAFMRFFQNPRLPKSSDFIGISKIIFTKSYK